MSKRYIVAIDEGTSSVRAVLFDVVQNKITSVSQQKFTQYYPNPGWVEHDAEEIWRKSEQCLLDILKQVPANEVNAIGITNQRETVVMWDKKTGKPIHHALVWQDHRSAEYCQKHFVKDVVETIYKKTGLIPDDYFSATKIAWLLKNVPKAKELLKENQLCVGTIESFLTYRLTKGQSFVSDITNACRTMLCNIKTCQWDDELLKMFKVDKKILPTIVENDQIVGQYIYKKEEIPIAGLIGDQQSSLFGNACYKKGDLKNTYGTGSFLLMNIGNDVLYNKNKILTTVAWKSGGKVWYALEGSVFHCGSCIDWLKGMNFIRSTAECEIIAKSVPDCNGVYFVPAFSGLGAPYWDGDARGLVCGLTRGTTPAHIVRAILDSITYSVKDVYDAMFQDMEITKGNIRVDGGVSRNDYIMQTQSNILSRNIERSAEPEGTSMGAIYMAGLATGVWKDVKELAKIYKPAKVFKPKIKKQQSNEMFEGWKEAISRTINKK